MFMNQTYINQGTSIMPKINFQKLEIQNFKSIGEATFIDFDSLNQITLVKGINEDIDGIDNIKVNNGSGKSTIIDAILFSLYGKTLCSISNMDLINRSIGNKLKTYVKLFFSIGNNKYVSEAFLNIRGKSDPTIGFTLKINDDEPISRNTVQMKQMMEEEIIGCPFDLFKSSIVISQSSYQNFYSMTKSQRVSYIEQLFKLTIFGDLLKLVRSDMRSDTIDYNSTNMAKGHASEQLQELSIKSNAFELEAKGKSDKIETSIKLKQSAIDSCSNELKQIGERVESTELQKLLIEYHDKISEKQTLISKCNAAISALESKKNSLSVSIGKHKEVLDVLCTDCYNKADKLLNITESKSQINECDEKIKKIKEAITSAHSEWDEFTKKCNDLSKTIENINSNNHKRELLENQLGYFTSELEEL